MKKDGRTTKGNVGRSKSSPAARKLIRARAALNGATTSDTWVSAVFRLMLGTVPGVYASAALRCSEVDVALWVNSNGDRLHSADLPRVMADHPGLPYLMQHPGLKVLPTRGVLPSEVTLKKTIFYRDFMTVFNWRHAVGLCFWKSNGPLDCVLSVHRTREEGDFSDEEIAALGALHEEIDRARLRVTAREEERFARSSYEHFADNLPLPIALLGWDLKPLYHNQLAREAVATWQDGPAARQKKTERIGFNPPPEILGACREMQAEWLNKIRSESQQKSVLERTVTQPQSPGLTATVRLLFLTGATLGDPTFMVQFGSDLPGGNARAPNLATLQRLTPAERAATTLAAGCKSNAEIADALGRSIGAVKAGLHAAYKKLGVRTRAELVSLLRP